MTCFLSGPDNLVPTVLYLIQLIKQIMATIISFSNLLSVGKVLTFLFAVGSIFPSLQKSNPNTAHSSLTEFVQTYMHNEMPEVTGESPYDYIGPLQSSTYFMAENFFRNYHNAVQHAALLRSIGFTEVAIVLSEERKFDVESGLYIIMITKPVSNVEYLYNIMESLRKHGLNHGYELNATRIVEIR